jgi:nucleoside-diphosphate-sugar epimerase
MRVLVTGANGFIGQALVKALLQAGSLLNHNQVSQAISELVLVDLTQPAHDAACGVSPSIRITRLAGDLADSAFVAELAALKPQAVFHLAASLTLQAEQDHETAFKVNVQPVRELIAGLTPATRLIFASSIAVFGGELPDVVSDRQRPAPATTYGTHKAIVELLMADAARKGLVDARSLRLPIILIRPGTGSGSVSDQVAAIVREPLAGRDVTCGLHPQTRMPVASAAAVAKALIQLHNLPAAVLPSARVMNLPSLTVTPEHMVQALRRTQTQQAKGEVHFEPNAALQAIVESWPREFVSETATRLGIHADASFDDIIHDYLAQQGASTAN